MEMATFMAFCIWLGELVRFAVPGTSSHQGMLDAVGSRVKQSKARVQTEDTVTKLAMNCIG